MKIINVCGYGNTGCTSQVDVLCDYEGVYGVLSPLKHTINGKSAYHEIGVLKCLHSLGGVLIARLNNAPYIPTRSELINSLLGLNPSDTAKLSFGAKLHLDMRALLAKHYGEKYVPLVHEALELLPNKFDDIPFEELVVKFQDATSRWLNGVISIVLSTPSLSHRDGEKVEILGLKNDPPGAYPLLATLIPNGLTSAILRDPRDTTYDFNRHYKLGHSDETVSNHCNHYNAQLNSARRQIERFGDILGDSYFVHDFENLVASESHRMAYVNRMIGDRRKVRSNFNVESSSKNIGHHVNLEPKQFKYVTDKCMANYESYREFLDTKGLLMAP